MIARLWRGTTRASESDAYLAYLQETGVKEYRATSGNRGVYVLRRVDDRHAEFLLVSLWDSVEAIRRFAGADIERAVFYPRDNDFLIARETRVTHYEVRLAPEDAP